MSALLKLFNMKAKGAWSDKSFTELLKELKNILPPDNELPTSLYEAKKTLMALGVDYEKIHACPNDCLLYRKKYKYDNFCKTCGVSRWKEKKAPSDTSKGVPEKVMWYFPPIPRFRRMFANPETAKDLTWHNLKKVADGKLRHPVDSPAWKQVDSKWPEFAQEPRNLRLGLSTDGFNPNNISIGGNYSCWPVMLVTYNLPPSLCMKRKFIMLTMLISGPKQPGNDIYVYLAPLIEDLKKLWEEGSEAYDSYKKEKFNFRAVLLWTISDFPAYGNLSGCPKGGYNACPICADRTSSIRLKYSQKNVYTGHRKFLPRKHKFRMEREAFNGHQELDPAPKPYSGEEVFSQVEAIENLWGKKVKSKPIYWKKKSILFELEYWKYLLIRHCLDVMHIEKNICQSIVGTLLNIPKKTKDGYNARKDLEDLGMRPELAPKENGKKAYLPPACFRLTAQEKKTFCKTLSELKVPTGYCSNLKNRVSMSDLKLYGLNSHDYHALMQEFLPLAIRSILPKHVRYAIIRLCFFFKEICTKEVDVDHLTEVQNDLVVTLCLLEKYFLPSFFDIMVHLTVHLIREVRLCGPVCFRWMYPFERFMKVLKGYIRNRNRVEGCIAEGYIVEEAMEICSEHLNIVTIGVPTDKSAQKPKNEESASLISEGKPLSTLKQHKVSDTFLNQAHLTVLNNSMDVQPYIELHMSHLREESPDKSEAWLLKEHNKTFSDWLEKKVKEELQNPNNDISQDLEWIACRPSHYVFKVEGYEVSGYRYHTEDRDTKRVNQNSGVSLVDEDNSCYYGMIQEIWLLDYHMIRIPVFKCAWVNQRGIRKDDLDYTQVELERLGHKNDPFIMASHAKQVFYVQDQLNPKLSIVISTRDKGVNVEEFVDESLVFEGNHTFENTFPAADSFDNNYESQSVLLRNNDGVWIEDITKELNKKTKKNVNPREEDNPLDDESSTEYENSTDDDSSMAGDSDSDYD